MPTASKRHSALGCCIGLALRGQLSRGDGCSQALELAGSDSHRESPRKPEMRELRRVWGASGAVLGYSQKSLMHNPRPVRVVSEPLGEPRESGSRSMGKPPPRGSPGIAAMAAPLASRVRAKKVAGRGLCTRPPQLPPPKVAPPTPRVGNRHQSECQIGSKRVLLGVFGAGQRHRTQPHTPCESPVNADIE